MPKPNLNRFDVRKLVDSRGGMKGEPVVLLAIRGYFEDSMGKPGENDRGIYDDAAWIVYPDHSEAQDNFNTDPSIKRFRIATLKTGTWWLIPGMHHPGKPGEHEAFRQFGEMAVSRDGAKSEKGTFWINLHQGGHARTLSEGCQTIPPGDWRETRDALYKAIGVTAADVRAEPQGVHGKQFRYELFDKAEAEAVLGHEI